MDGRLRHGICTHQRNVEVNVYSDGGLETFDGDTRWVSLEVKCTNTKELSRGREHRYCINGSSYHICHKVALVALLVPYEEVPNMVALS